MKILIVRFSSIGDIVLTTPVIRCVKQQLKASVHFLTKKTFRSVLEGNPYLDHIHTIDQSINEVVEKLKLESYDYIIDLHKNLRTLDLRRQLKVKTYAFDKLNIQKWLLVNLKLNFLPKQHIVDRYLDTVRPLGVRNDNKGLDIFIPSEDEVCLADHGLLLNEYVVFAVGAAHFTKQIPIEKVLDIIAALKEKRVVLIGGRGDMDKASQILAETDRNVVDLTGRLNLMQSASIIRQAALVVSPDTGMMHISAALKKKIIVLWGSTVPEFGMYPYGTTYENFEVKGLSCRPCSKIGNKSCPRKHFNCMNEQSISSIQNQVNIL